MENNTTQAEREINISDDKTLAIVAYLTVIGLVVALIMNKEKKSAFAAFHVKQSCILCALGFAVFLVGMVPLLGWVISFFGSLFLLYLWIMGLFNAINGKVKPVPVFGRKFEEWFKNV